MVVELIQVIEQIGREKGIEREVLIEAVGAAILSATRKKLGTTQEMKVDFDEASRQFVLYYPKRVVEEVADSATEIALEEARAVRPETVIGDEVRFTVESQGFGRIEAQTAKQVIIQRVREAERDSIYQSFKNREGELITGIVQRVVKSNVIVNVGKAEAILPQREQLPHEDYRPGDRIRAYIVEVKRSSRGSSILLSRSHPGMLMHLFEVEVPEIEEGIVEIRAAAREPGERAKIAVVSRDANVDPVGACVGYRGSRVQAVVRELAGEKIDIIPWRDHPAEFVRSALAPAQVEAVTADEPNRTLQVIVADDQLSLAIGKRGQNARLAAKLVGWKVDIKSRAELRREAENRAQAIQAVREYLGSAGGIGPKTVERLIEGGFASLRRIAEASVEELTAVKGIGGKGAERIRAAAAEAVVKHAEAQAAAQAAARAAAEAEAAPETEAETEARPPETLPGGEEEGAIQEEEPSEIV